MLFKKVKYTFFLNNIQKDVRPGWDQNASEDIPWYGKNILSKLFYFIACIDNQSTYKSVSKVPEEVPFLKRHLDYLIKNYPS